MTIASPVPQRAKLAHPAAKVACHHRVVQEGFLDTFYDKFCR
jgi:hypothetical protein